MAVSRFVLFLIIIPQSDLIFAQYISRGAAKNRMNDTLPGYAGKIPFKMYSGYLKASENHFLHYWLVESKTNPAIDPLILWMNGGPGCSSMGGALEELGPFNLTDQATLIDNEWTWNKQANILFLESPAGVGWSFSGDFSVNASDTQTSLHNYAAIKDFFFQYPQFSRHDFYIIGESYAGVYIPTLTERIIDNSDNFTVNLKGIGLGNGMLSEFLNIPTTVEFSYVHGLIDEDEYHTIVKRCCGGCMESCDLSNITDPWCEETVGDALVQVWLGGLNPYDVYRTCYHNPGLGKTTVSNGYLVRLKWMAPDIVRKRLPKAPKDEGDDDDSTIIISDPTCSNETAITQYMNRADVRKAFHIPYHVGFWTHCKAHVKWQYQKEVFDVTPQIRKALKNDIRVLLYHGDADMACNWMMGQKFAERLGLPLMESKRPYKYANGQVGGFITRYQGLDFATIKGAGHMAPGWRAEQNYHLIDSFIRNKDY